MLQGQQNGIGVDIRLRGLLDRVLLKAYKEARRLIAAISAKRVGVTLTAIYNCFGSLHADRLAIRASNIKVVLCVSD